MAPSRSIADQILDARREASDHPTNRRAHIDLCTLLVQARQFASALEAAEEGLRFSPGDTKLLSTAAGCAFRLGKAHRSVDFLRKAVAEKPTDASLFIRLAEYLTHIGDLDSAHAAATKANDLVPGHGDVAFRLSDVLQRQGRSIEALRQARIAVARRPDNGYYLYRAAKLMYDLGLFEDARRLLEKRDDVVDAEKPAATVPRHLPLIRSTVQRAEKSAFVLANCSRESISRCMEALAPQLKVGYAGFRPRELASPEHVRPVAEMLAKQDYIFYQPGQAQGLLERVIAKHKCAIPFPALYFPAFHPDQTSIKSRNGNFAGPIGAYNSALVLYAFKKGLGLREARQLFNRSTFSRLDYLRLWRPSREMLAKSGAALDFPLDHLITQWVRRGCFMYHYNHPKLFVHESVARQLLKKVGIEPRSIDCCDYIADPHASAEVFPVYPEIAAEFGWKGSTVFKAPPLDGAERFFDLEQFIETSFELLHADSQSPLTAACLTERRFLDLDQGDGAPAERPYAELAAAGAA